MFYYSAAMKLSRGEKIQIFNYGDMKRDFTFIDDIIEGVFRVMKLAPSDEIPYQILNIGGGQPENLLDFISTLQEELVHEKILPENYDFEAHRELVGMQPGDVPITYADNSQLEREYNFVPKVGIREGLRSFAQWFAKYYNSVKI